MMEKIKILLVDDQILFIESLKSVLETIAEDIFITELAHNGREALESIKKDPPEIVLLDVRMPVMDGVETVKIIHKKYPGIKVMMLTTFDDDEYVHEALKHGAAGYMLKDVPPENLVDSIRAIKAGTVQISPRIMVKLVNYSDAESLPTQAKDSIQAIEALSRREKEILYLISKDLDNVQIGEKLFIAEQTVKNHVHSIYSKLSIHDRSTAMKIANSAHIKYFYNES
ncbi:MAG: DNA-binding response regulator [Spirochaetes bacterium]|nr:MAG: DNA-binding response regulator [Spirochaetota bacterium]